MTSTITRIAGPRDVIAILPSLCGFTPEESAIALFLGHDNRVILCARVDLAGADATDWTGIARQVDSGDSNPSVIAIMVSEHPASTLPRAWMGALAQEVTVRDELWHNPATGQTASYFCEEPSCCPFEASMADPILVGTSLPLPSRNALRDGVRFVGPDLLDGRSGDDSPDFWTITETVNDLTRSERPADIPGFYELMVTLALACRTILGRDTVIGSAAANPGHIGYPVIEAIARQSNDPHLLCVLAAIAYMEGNGGLANVLLDRADAIEKLSFSGLLEQFFGAGLPPKVLRDTFTASLVKTQEKSGA